MKIKKPRIAVLYHYFEKENAVKSIIHLLCKGYSKEIDFYISISSGTSLVLPYKDNIKYFFTENDSFDYGGFSKIINDGLEIDLYDYFIFLNSSCVGPFLPAYYKESYTRPFLDLLVDDVAICGPIVHIRSVNHVYSKIIKNVFNIPPPHSFVASFCYAMTKEALKYLKENEFYKNNQYWSKDDTVMYYEMAMSLLLLKNNWNIASFLPGYQNIDYRKLKIEDMHKMNQSVAFQVDGYFNRNLTPLEVIFYKLNMPNTDVNHLNHSFNTLINNVEIEGSSYENAINMPIIRMNGRLLPHSNFIQWIIQEIQSDIIVSLGIDDPSSVLLFSLYSDQQKCRVFCIDSIQSLDTDDADYSGIVKSKAAEIGLTNISIIQGDTLSVAKRFDNKIDILCINRLNDYQLIEDDYNQWNHLLKDEAVVLIHNTQSSKRDAKVFFDRIELPKVNIRTANGLGVVTRNTDLLERIRKIHSNILERT